MLSKLANGKNALYSWFLSIPVSKKLFLIYFFGIFIPLFSSGIYFTGKLMKAAKVQEKNHLSNIIDSITGSIEEHLKPLSLVSKAIIADTAIYRFVSLDYSKTGNYYQIHSDYLRPTLYKYISGFSGIAKILIYIDNPSIGVSAGYLSMNDINRNSIWYKTLSYNKHDSVVMMYNETDFRTSMEEEVFCSYFRHMTNQTVQNSNEIILRMDIQISMLEDLISEQPLKGHIELADSFGNIMVGWSSGNIDSNDPSLTRIHKQIKFANGIYLKGRVAVDGPSIAESFKIKNYLIVTLLSISLTLIFIFLLSISVTSRIQVLSSHMRKVENEDFSPIIIDHPGLDEIGILLKDFNIMTERIKFLITRVYKAEVEHHELLLTQKQAELETLQSQVNPHFLNNVLESIRMRSILKDETETANIILKLSRLFRRMLQWKDDLITLEDEILFTKEYLDIQKYRYGDQLELTFTEDYTVGLWKIPRITLQGIVENACIHGIEKTKDTGRISIEIREEKDSLFILVKDNGIGFSDDQLVMGIGLSNIKQRLKLYYKDEDTMNLKSIPGKGTSVIIKLSRERH